MKSLWLPRPRSEWIYYLLAACISLGAAPHRASAQVSVGPNGSGLITFDAQPGPPAWATRSISGSSGSIINAAALAASVQTNDELAISSPLAAASISPSLIDPLTIWNSSGSNLVTRPTGNAYTLLLARCVNDSGIALPEVELSYDFRVLYAGTEEVPGHLVYYSLTGATNSWINIPSLSGGSNGARRVTLDIGNWAPSAPLYFLWADDNASAIAPPDAANSIDNVSVGPPPLALITEPLDQLVSPGAAAQFSVAATGIKPLRFQWFKGAAPIDAATNSALTLTNLTGAETGSYSVSVSDPRGSITSRVASLTVACVPITFLAQPTNQVLDVGARLDLSTTITGSPPFMIQWRNGDAVLATSTNASSAYWIIGVGPADSGMYFAVASNCAGFATSAVAAISVSCLRPPILTNLPVAQNIFTGGTLTLAAAASGSPVIQYQWYRYDAAIPNATNSSYVKTNLNVSDTAMYRVSASNCAGTTSSTNFLVSVSDRPYAVVSLTNHAWRYNQSGADLRTVWRDPAYDDSAWPVGLGVFAREDSAAIVALTRTPLSLTSPAGDPLVTYYFRTTFVLTNDPAALSLITSNLFDDGLVMYVNGREAYRMNMAAGPVTSRTFAPGTTTENIYWLTNVASDLFVSGTNTLAVEVHQVNTTSSDIVMGFHANVAQTAPTALIITNQPDDQVTPEAQTIAIEVGVEGAPMAFQWFKDGIAIPGATKRALLISNAAPADSGLYAVFVSNAVTRAMSRLAAVSVIHDDVSPRVLAADFVDVTHILLAFSEPIAAGSVTPDRFRILASTGGEVAVMSALQISSANVLLGTGTLLGSASYVVEVSGVTDISPGHLAIANGSRVPVARLRTVLPPDAPWFFYDPFPDIGDDPAAPSGWNWPSFSVPPDWGYAPGGFIAGVFGELPPVPFNSGLSTGPAITSYFRKEFGLNVSRAGLRIFADLFCNDGAVVFLNGVEVARVNMSDLSTYATPATAAAIGVLSNRLDLPSSLLLPETNVLAVELHQAIPNDFTKAFALTLSGRVESDLGGPLQIFSGPDDSMAEEGHPVTFRISAAGARFFQWRLNGEDVPGATGPEFTLMPSYALNGAAIAVRIADTSSSLLSSNAALRVIPDTTPPQLILAKASNDMVTVLFSEAVSADSAQDPANYTIIDGVGHATPVLSAILARGTNVTLRVASPLFVGNTLVVSNIGNTALSPVLIAPGSALEIATSALIIPLDATWRYEQSGADLGAGWKLPGYNDSTWPSGSALFWAKRGIDPPLPIPVGTVLNLSNANATVQIPSYYFRTTFALPYPVTVQLVSSLIVDDGAIVYINGSETFRIGMPSGSVTRSTLAARTIAEPLVERLETAIPVTLPAGENVIAVEAHQATLDSSDFAFAADFTLVSERPGAQPILPMPLSIKRWGGNFAFEWAGTNSLQASDSITGPWRVLGGPAPFFASPTGSIMFYRLGP